MTYSLKRIYKKHSIGNALHVLLVSGMVACAALYLYQMNGLAAEGFEIQSLETKKESLYTSIRNLTWDISEARAITTVRARAAQLDLSFPESTSYLSEGLDTVAAVDHTSDLLTR